MPAPSAPSWRHPLRNHIDRLKTIRDRLSTPVEFFETHQAGYVEMAKLIAESVLILARPLDIEPEEWAFRVRVMAAAIGSVLVNAEEVMLSIFFDARQFEQLEFENVATGTFAKDTVLNWVRAGRAEDPLGKHFDDRDTGDSDETIAARVWWAMYTGRSQHSAEAIRQYLDGKTKHAAMDHLPAVLSAWSQTIAPAARKDWRVFVKSVIRAE